MITSILRRGSVAMASAARRGWARACDWVDRSPWLAAWVYPPEETEGEDAHYRRFNQSYFASWHQQERMLADRPRVDFYHELIRRQVRPGDRVIDLGTGTGILAAWASRAGASRVWALDHSDILEDAKRLAVENGIERVEFVATHSTDFTLPEPVDVIVHEQMGDFLFDEGMVRNVCDLRDRLLKPGGRILPGRFELYCEPVQVRADRHVPFIWELNVHGFDYASLERNRPQDDEYYRLASCDEGVVEAFLGEPVPIMTFDLHTIDERALAYAVNWTRVVRRPGWVHALAVYFRVVGEGGRSLTTNPLDSGRSPHWGFRLLRLETQEVAAGDELDLTLEAGLWSDSDSWRWTYEVRPVPVPV